jgi:hypothetical protein
MVHRWLLLLAACLLLVSTGCENKSDFDGDTAKAVLEASPVALDSEQVTIVQKQLDCGVEAELWEAPVQVSPGHSVARLTPKGHALHFSDDPTIESIFHQPFAQVRGEFMLSVDQPSEIRNGEEDGTKLVVTKARIKVPNDCFVEPLPIMGVKHRNFREDTPLTFLLRLANDGWHVEKLLH